MPEISVVVPIYNVERYLSQCVDSILQQTFVDFELILVDDGSTDNSFDICKKYERLDSRIKIVHQENEGLSSARNAGIDIASGRYIMFVDSDDFLLPGMIDELHSICTKYKADISCCDYMRCREDGAICDAKNMPTNSNVNIYIDDKMKVFLEGKSFSVTAWGKLYRTDLFSKVRYPIGMYHEDVYTTYKLIHLANKIAVTNSIGYVYRYNSCGITGSFSPKRFNLIEAKIEQVEFIEQYYPELADLSYVGIVYACNQCLSQMSKSGYSNLEMERIMQRLYRKYLVYYLKSRASIVGKMYAIVAFINVKIAKQITV